MVTAPAAVAAHLAAVTGHRFADGSCTLVCDAGAAGMRLTILQHATTGVQQLATATVTDGGGHDIDRSLAAHLLNGTGPHRPTSRTIGDDPQWMPVVEAARRAKEDLAGQSRTVVALPEPHLAAIVDRTELAALVEPVADRLAATVTTILADADIDRSYLAAVILTGGGAHLPGVAHALTVVGAARRSSRQWRSSWLRGGYRGPRHR